LSNIDWVKRERFYRRCAYVAERRDLPLGWLKEMYTARYGKGHPRPEWREKWDADHKYAQPLDRETRAFFIDHGIENPPR